MSMDIAAAEARMEEIAADMVATSRAKSLGRAETTNRILALEDEFSRLEYDVKNYKQGLKFRAASEITPGGQPMANVPVKTKGASWQAAAPSDATEDQWRACFEAAQRGQNYRFEIQPTVKAFSDGSNVRTKSPLVSGSFGGLPAVIQPGLTQQLPYEPTRLFTEYIQMAMDAPTVEYLVHTGNANVAGPVAELGTKPDIGIQVTARTVTATKLAGLASISIELFHDFSTFASFVPVELQRALIDAESDWLISSAVNGLIWQTNTLTRLVGADSYLDAISKAIDDIRVGPMLAQADTVVVHPRTFGLLKRQKDTLGRYILVANPETGVVDSIWDCKVVQTTKLPMNYVIVFDSKVAILGFTRQSLIVEMNMWSDTAWTTNQILWRAEERIGVGYQKPLAIDIVTGFPGAGS